MTIRRLLCVLLACIFLAGGCAIYENAVRKRATFDLDCPKEQLEIEKLGVGTYGVRGCGRKASYVCPTNTSQCVLDSIDGHATKTTR